MRNAKFICAVAVLLACAGVAVAAKISDKDAVVDLKTVFDGYPKCVEARKKLNASIEPIKAELAAKLAKEKDGTARNALLAQYNEMVRTRTVATMAPIIDEVKIIVGNVAKSQGFERVYDKGENVKGVDITQSVLSALNGNKLPPAHGEAEKAAQQAKAKAEAEKAAQQAKAKAEAEKAAQQAKAKAEAEKAAQQAKAKAEAEKTAQQAKAQQAQGAIAADRQKTSIEVQFGADYDVPDITRMVKKAQKNGIGTAYVYTVTGKNGKPFCRARVPASDMEEAKEISRKLKAIGFNNYIVK